ncbi:MAG: nucleoside deaminase [Bacilli bacterium]|nr:nucleoside deaminase [Bacilli bacterium]
MDQKFLDLAFKYAEKAYKNNEVPIGAVIIKNNEVIGYGYNQKEKKNSVLEHAEIMAIRMASKKINNWRLDDCDIYVTLDPCPMCASAIKQSRIKNIYSALGNLDKENEKVVVDILKKDKTNPEVSLISNIEPEKSKKILNSFFSIKRDK